MRQLKISISLMCIVTLLCCKKNVDKALVQVETNEISSISINAAVCKATIDNIDKVNILEVGVCWDTISLPTISGKKTSERVQEIQTFEFQSMLTNLRSSKDYYVRAYAKTNEEVFYGSQQKFTTLSLDSFLVDFDFKLDQAFAPCKLTITNKSKYVKGCSWSFEGAGLLTSNKFTPVNIDYSKGGTYLITLTGCSDSYCKTVSKKIVIENSDIEFNDPVLEKRIRLILNKPTGPITKSLAKTITTLVLLRPVNDTTNINNIEALKYFSSLKELDLSNNKVADLTSISELTSLENLNLYNNGVIDLSPLEKLTNLKELNLWHNQITDVGQLSKLTKMENLNMGANWINDISPIKGITTITSLWLNANAYTVDTVTIKSLSNLTTLAVTGCKLNSIHFVRDLTNLVDLLFESNYISDISALKNLSKLRTLYCSYNNIKDFKVLENLYMNGCFKLPARFTYHINITNNGTDATSGSENRRIIDMLTGNSVKISCQTGNSF
jgi:hypothetical protein